MGRPEINNPGFCIHYLIHQSHWHDLVEGVEKSAVIKHLKELGGIPSKVDRNAGHRQHFGEELRLR